MVSKKSAVKTIPIAKSYFDRRESDLVSKVIASGWIAQGRSVQDFETVLSGYTGAKYAVAVSSGTTALHLALIVSGIGPGDEVIIPSFSFIATANSVLQSGAKPVFIDIDPETYNIDPVEIAKFLKEGCRYDAKMKRLVNKKTGGTVRAIMPVHQFGLAFDLGAIEEIANKHGLKLVEDAACGLGASYRKRKIGDGRNMSCFSFHPRKIITTGEGGVVLTNDRLLADKIRVLRNHGASLSAMDKHISKKAVSEDYEVLGYNYRLTDLQAAIGIAQMDKLPMILKKRLCLAKNYDNALKGVDCIRIPFIPAYATPNYQSYVVRIDDSCPVLRDELVEELLSFGISTRRGNTAIHMQSLYRPMKMRGLLPETEMAASRTIALPIYTDMTETEQRRVIDGFLGCMKRCCR